MNKFVIKENSTIYKFLKRWDKDYRYGWDKKHDICGLARDLFKNILKVFAIGFATFSALIDILMILVHNHDNHGIPYFQLEFTLNGFMSWVVLFIGFAVLIGVAFGLFLCVLYWLLIMPLLFLYEKIENHNVKSKSPGFISTWYKSVKNKYCAIVEYEDEQH